MNQDSGTSGTAPRQDNDSMAALRRFVRPRSRAAVERCDLCGTPLEAVHQHIVELSNRQLLCACDECAVSMGDQEGAKYRRVPRRTRLLDDFQLADAQWDSLMIPVGMAFFFYSSAEKRVIAFYPSPAGATESLLDLESWQEVVRDNPILEAMQPDVEALLVNRLRDTREYYLAPIDKCYELVGLIRTNWKGLSGGLDVWAEIARFYADLNEQAEPIEATDEIEAEHTSPQPESANP